MRQPKNDNQLADVLERLEGILKDRLTLSDNLTVPQAAKELNVSADVIYEALADKSLTHYRYGKGRGTIRIKRSDLEAWNVTRRVDATANHALVYPALCGKAG